MNPVTIRLLPDKSGRVRIHWFKRDQDGAVAEREATGELSAIPKGHPCRPGAAGFIACQKALTSLNPQAVGGTMQPVCHTDDPRAATCPECLASEEHKAALAELEEFAQLTP